MALTEEEYREKLQQERLAALQRWLNAVRFPEGWDTVKIAVTYQDGHTLAVNLARTHG